MIKAQNHKLQKAYIRRYTLTDGKENGIKVVELDNGILRVLLNESKGLDIMQLFHNGVNISFVSRNGFTARDIDFMNRFEGGMLYTCGFDSIGGRDGFEVHGSYHTYPSRVISILESESALQVVAEVEITSLFGENLLFLRKITLPVDSQKLIVDDKLINRGTREENYCLLYHVNLGYPMLDEGVKVLADIESIAVFTSCSAALAYATHNFIDVAFLDINMRGIGGLGLAEKLLDLNPHCHIIFCTGYEEYAVSAFQLHVSGYLMKPITAEAVQKEINHIKGTTNTKKQLTIQCFGNFEVFYNGEILPFKRKKTKELLAVLIDRNGAGMTAKQLCTVLFLNETDDEKNSAYIRQLVLDLKNTLKAIHLEDVLKHDTPYYRVDTQLIRCDYLSFLECGKPQFHGEYMMQYSWAEETCAILQFKK